MAYDFKKEYKDLYAPKTAPSGIDVPMMTFIMIDGEGDPNTSVAVSKRRGNAVRAVLRDKNEQEKRRSAGGLFRLCCAAA
jgi:hypothetical protein